MADSLRILDANANRASEALRMLEDLARFILDDKTLAAQAKHGRHELRALLEPVSELLWHRDTPGDVGTTVTTTAEQNRASHAELAEAAGHRAAEALRVIEEMGKTLVERPGCASIAHRAEALRYRTYTLHQQIVQRLGSGQRRQWRLCLLLTESTCLRPWQEVLSASLEAGVDCIQVREKAMDAAALLHRVREVIALARPKGAAVIVNDRTDIALAAEADGVHLGQDDLPLAEARKLAGRRLLIGISTTNLEQADGAIAQGADYVGLGPMYPSSTKHKPRIAGCSYLSEYLAQHQLPHLAIGGITTSNLQPLIDAGARGIAVCATIAGAEDPGAAARQLLRQIPGETGQSLI